MGPTSAKFDPEMEDKDGQNPIQIAEIFAAADARTSAITARECSRRSAEEADPTDARPLWSSISGSNLAEVGPIRSSPYPAIYVRTGSATRSALPVVKRTSLLPIAEPLRAKSYRAKA